MFLRRPTLFLRFAVCLLAVLQGVAVSWHICDLGGPHGGAAHCYLQPQGATAAPCHTEDDPTRAWHMALGAPPRTAPGVHCLAALLSTTPAQTAGVFVLDAPRAARSLLRTPPLTPLCEALARGANPRGPPAVS